MAISETEFNKQADRWLTKAFDVLEALSGTLPLEVEYQNGILHLVVHGKTWLVTKHAPTKQLWLSSPVSGGLHFPHGDDGEWKLPDGRALQAVIATELGMKKLW